MSDQTQTQLLESKLPKDAVASRQAGYGSVNYLEGWYVIEALNRVFGFDGWSGEVVELTETLPTVERESKDKQGNPKKLWHCAYRCTYRLTVKFETGEEVIREDAGSGNGVANFPHESEESAQKEAVTDAMKRAARTFGNRFGLGLYDKKQRGVEK